MSEPMTTPVPCRYCGKPLAWLYPDSDLPIVAQFSHTNREDAAKCTVPDWSWPHPETTTERNR